MAEIHQNHLQRREDRVGEQYAENPEQGSHQKLHRQQHRRGEVDRPPRDEGQDDIALEIVDEEINEDRPHTLVGAGREADRDHQNAADDRADVGDEGEHPGEKTQKACHRHAADHQQDESDDPLKGHADQPPKQQPPQREAGMLGNPVKS
jgi:hypothetical protein